MGLLDEAIREHLELKRRRGADPAEVAREQHEALDPISAPAPAAEPPDDATEGALVEDLPTEEHALDAEALDPERAETVGGEQSSKATAAGAGAFAPTRSREPEETAELDMSTVLDDEPSGQARAAASVGEDAHGGLPADDHLQLEHGPTEGAAGSKGL